MQICHQITRKLLSLLLFFSFLKGFYSSVGIVCCIAWLTLDKDIPFGFEMLVVVAAVGGVVVVVVAVGLSN